MLWHVGLPDLLGLVGGDVAAAALGTIVVALAVPVVLPLMPALRTAVEVRAISLPSGRRLPAGSRCRADREPGQRSRRLAQASPSKQLSVARGRLPGLLSPGMVGEPQEQLRSARKACPSISNA